MTSILWLSFGLSIVLLLLIMGLVRRRRLKEQYALLWIGFGVIMIVLSLNSAWLNGLASLFYVYYAPSLLFLFGIVFCLLLIIHLTVVLSSLSDKVIRLVQEVSMLKKELHEWREKETTP
jgi:hypothetical protein